MAYRFDGVDDVVQFALGPMNGYSVGPVTYAALVKRGATSASAHLLVGVDSGTSLRRTSLQLASDLTTMIVGTTTKNAGTTLTSTSVWYIIAATFSGATAAPRFHVWNGTTWTHTDAGTTFTANTTAATTGDTINIGGRSLSFTNGDIVCAGIKKASSSDAAIEALSPTLFSAWQAFGFDWLVGFDAATTRTNRVTPGSGDETARVGTTLVADPAGWLWTAPTAVPDPATTDWVPVWNLDAATLLTGTGAPSSSRGSNGSIYLDTATGYLYGPKAAGAWPGTPLTVPAGVDATTSAKGIVQLAGDLAGTAASPQIAAGVITDADVATANKDGVAATASMRTLGTGAQQAASGTDSRFTSLARPAVSYGTTPPGSPADGDLWYLPADATNGVIWCLRYRSGSSSAYKWEFVGGPPLVADVATFESTTSASYVELATVQRLTIPRAGDYMAAFGAVASGNVASDTFAMAIDAVSAVAQGQPAMVNGSEMLMLNQRVAGQTSGATWKLVFARSFGSGTVSFSGRWMRCTPIRIS